MTTTTSAELCADCYRTKPICGWHLDPNRRAVLAFAGSESTRHAS